MKTIPLILLLVLATGCGSISVYPQTHESFTATVAQHWTMPNGAVRDTSASLVMAHDGLLNGDTMTSGSLSISPSGETHVDGARKTTFSSATSAWAYLIGALGGVAGTRALGF